MTSLEYTTIYVMALINAQGNILSVIHDKVPPWDHISKSYRIYIRIYCPSCTFSSFYGKKNISKTRFTKNIRLQSTIYEPCILWIEYHWQFNLNVSEVENWQKFYILQLNLLNLQKKVFASPVKTSFEFHYCNFDQEMFKNAAKRTGFE